MPPWKQQVCDTGYVTVLKLLVTISKLLNTRATQPDTTLKPSTDSERNLCAQELSFRTFYISKGLGHVRGDNHKQIHTSNQRF